MNQEQLKELAFNICDCIDQITLQLVTINAISQIDDLEAFKKVSSDYFDVTWNLQQRIADDLEDIVCQLLGGD